MVARKIKKIQAITSDFPSGKNEETMKIIYFAAKSDK